MMTLDTSYGVWTWPSAIPEEMYHSYHLAWWYNHHFFPYWLQVQLNITDRLNWMPISPVQWIGHFPWWKIEAKAIFAQGISKLLLGFEWSSKNVLHGWASSMPHDTRAVLCLELEINGSNLTSGRRCAAIMCSLWNMVSLKHMIAMRNSLTNYLELLIIHVTIRESQLVWWFKHRASLL